MEKDSPGIQEASLIPSSECCPKCYFNLDGGDIYEYYLTKNNGNKREAREFASLYGWCEEAPQRFKLWLGIYDYKCDGITHYICPKCETFLAPGSYFHHLTTEKIEQILGTQRKAEKFSEADNYI